MPDIFIFSETWYNLSKPIYIPGYTGCHTVRNGRSGGVSIFYKSCLNAIQVSELSISNSIIETCTIKLTASHETIYINGIYRPVAGNIDDFCIQMEWFVNHATMSSNLSIFCGDFNLNLFSDSDHVNRFIDTMRSHHYVQTITNITRPNLNNLARSTLIDQIWLNRLTNYHSGTIATGISDHYSTFLQLPWNSTRPNCDKIKVTFRDCSLPNEQIFASNLNNYNWASIQNDDVNQYTMDFIHQLNTIYQNSFPIKTKFVTIEYFKNPWHTKNIRKLSNLRSQYYDLFLKGFVSREAYNKFRNKITTAIRKTKESYYNKLFTKNMKDTKATWKLINKMCTNSTKKSSIANISVDNSVYDEPSDIAEQFNRFFVNIAENLSRELPTTNESPYTHIKTNEFNISSFNPITPDEISQIICSLKITKQNIDHISVEMFKKYHTCFLPVLCDIFNLCLDTGTFPNCFKHATVIPIPKKGDPSNMSNYRPIAILPFMSKIIERCIYNRLTEFASLYNILSPYQFGFRKGHSTQDAIFLLTEQIHKCFNERNDSFCINIFIDFQKCFDTIDHEILINKLALYGLSGNCLNLMKNYLCNRSQSVKISNYVSSPLPILRGVPQGSILGPLLFLFFINDLPNISDKFTPILFADDTTLSFRCLSVERAGVVCSGELEKFFKWSTSNKLIVNKSKTFFLTHTFNKFDENSIKISMNNHEIKKLEETTFLGLKIDSKLNFRSHIDNISTKISKSIGILYKLKSVKTPKSILKQVYFSLIHSHLNYVICTYAGTYPSYLNRLLLLQKRAIRIINNESYLAHTNLLFQSNKILKIQDMYKLSIGIYMYDHLENYFRAHDHNTRAFQDLLPAQSRLTATSHSIHVIGPKIYNSIPNDIKLKPNRNSFKYHYRQHLLAQYTNLSS